MKRSVLWFTTVCLTMTILMSGLLFAADLININTASREELKTLQGIGQVRADAIIKYREAHGPFKSLDELRKSRDCSLPRAGSAVLPRITNSR